MSPPECSPKSRAAQTLGSPGEEGQWQDAAEEMTAGKEPRKAGGDIPPEINPHSSQC